MFERYDEELNDKLLAYSDDGTLDPFAWQYWIKDAIQLPPPPKCRPPPIEYPPGFQLKWEAPPQPDPQTYRCAISPQLSRK